MPDAACPACRRPRRGGFYALRSAAGQRLKCLRCSLVDRRLVRRSTKVALVVGTILVFLNQGGALLSGAFPWATSWFKIPLTYLVPFCVATYGALANGYRPATAAQD